MLNIIGLTKKELSNFCKTEEFNSFGFAPISVYRALSQSQNPRALESDVLLFLAFVDNELAGYLGILPDDVTKADYDDVHFGWLSTFYVDPKFRGMMVAPELLLAAEKAYEKKIIITEFTPVAGRLYRKIKLFQDLANKKATRYYFKSNLANLLPAKRVFFEKNKIWLKRIDAVANTLLPYFGKKTKARYKISKAIDKPLEEFISQQPKNTIGRSVAEFRWMLEYPWLSTNKKQAHYLFSSYADQYEMFWVSLYQHQEIATAYLCSVRDGHLKILYWFGQPDLVAESLPNIVAQQKAKMMTIYDETLNFIIKDQKRLKPIYKRPLLRKYLIHKNFKQILGEDFDFAFADGDGDFSFT